MYWRFKMTNVNTMSVADQMKAKIAEKMAAAKEAAQLKLLTNDAFQDVLVVQMMREESTNTLASLVEQCATVVNTNKVYNPATRQERVWKPAQYFGFGNQFNLVVQLLNGINYAVQEHTDLLLCVTGLSKDLIERTLLALGSNAYYSTNYSAVIEGTATNIPELLSCLELLEYTLNIQIDKSMIKKSVVDQLAASALAKAEKLEAEAQLANTMANYIIN